MKRELRKYLLAVLTAGFAVVGTGCETLQPNGLVMEPIENYGGGGGESS